MAHQERNGYQFPEYLTGIFAQASTLNAAMLEVRSKEIRRLLDTGIALHEEDAKSLMEDFDKAADCVSSAIGSLADYAGTTTRATMFQNVKEWQN